ncbi:uridylate kinase [Thermogymnomonas acidicola]|uniref:Uridylate kinase n=1 Tax=Thermogymnomonas acidicola TaxID=399579 RepID=A0AA37BTD0_9ARCH|nr:UMP kinase [Thermogymnomonas acidicola]GGM79105.1 uridylate kinase [Thermogymnomonas acidicola]
MKCVVISLGGSIVSRPSLDVQFIRDLSSVLRDLPVDRVGIVVGGGALAREYIGALRPAGVNENVLDEIGIHATRMNALAIASLLDGAPTEIPENINDAAKLLRQERYVVMGGTEPGHTTDTVSALLAERIGSRVMINATSVDGVYTADPRKDRGARKLRSLTYEEAIELAMREASGAGQHVFMDITALTIARRSSIRVHVIDGRDLGAYVKASSGEEHGGTVIG